MKEATADWWKQAIVYEIATVSFQDSNDDGKGDLAGLLRRLDYLEYLGITTVWLTPIFPSPGLDFGYDIADYCAVDPALGTLEQFNQVVNALHERDIRLIIDFVPNHTSNLHPWFVESRSSRTNARKDWYLWADAAPNGGPPNNWLSRFGGSAWQWDEIRGQYFYHSFLAEQPDLNWRNVAVRRAMQDVMRFWLDRGVDGFRVDASAVLIKDALLRDNPANPEFDDSMPPPQRYQTVFTDDRPEAMGCLEDMRETLDSYSARLICGEVQGKTARIGHFYKGERPRLHLPLNFALLDAEWNALSLQAAIDAYYNAIPADAWPVWVVGGHDKHRVASKLGQAQARVLAMLLFTLKGTPFFFMGDEIGAEQVRIPDNRVHDPFEKLVPGYDLGRDPERSPLRWDASAQGGFTNGTPWLPLGAAERNIEDQRRQPDSMLNLYRALIDLKKSTPCLTRGDYRPIRSEHDILAFERSDGERALLIALNIASEPRQRTLQAKGRRLISTCLDQGPSDFDGKLFLRGNEGVIFDLS